MKLALAAVLLVILIAPALALAQVRYKDDEFPNGNHNTSPGPVAECRASTLKCEREPLAQTVEHLPFKQGVPGSSPGRLTTAFQ